MRVIAGERKGLRLNSFRNSSIRPTADSTKELIFNVIHEKMDESRVLDIFAGTGSLGIEALSRGATEAVFVESNRPAQNLIRNNLEKTGYLEKSKILGMPFERALKLLGKQKNQFNLIFADPPYLKGYPQSTVEKVSADELLSPGGCLIIEQSLKEQVLFSEKYKLIAEKKRGDSTILFYGYEQE